MIQIVEGAKVANTHLGKEYKMLDEKVDHPNLVGFNKTVF